MLRPIIMKLESMGMTQGERSPMKMLQFLFEKYEDLEKRYAELPNVSEMEAPLDSEGGE